MNADVIADGIVLGVLKLLIIGGVCGMFYGAVQVAWSIWTDWRDARKVKRAAKRAQAKPVSLESYVGMRGH